mgnify:CR=1 FL=1
MDELIFEVSALAVGDLRGSRLSGYIVPLYPRFIKTFVDDADEHRLELIGGFFRNGNPHHLRRNRNLLAAFLYYLFHNLGTHEFSSVGYWRICADELERRDGNSLPK